MIFGIIIVTLLVFLVTKELASASESESAQQLGSFLTVPIIPLLVFFVLLFTLRVIEMSA